MSAILKKEKLAKSKKSKKNHKKSGVKSHKSFYQRYKEASYT